MKKKKNFLLIEQLICSVLRPDMRVLEFGSGGSTTLFSPFVKQWISIEHDKYWAQTVNDIHNKLSLLQHIFSQVEDTVKKLSLSDKGRFHFIK